MQEQNQECKKDGSLCEWYRLDMGHKLCIHEKNRYDACRVERCPIKEME